MTTTASIRRVNVLSVFQGRGEDDAQDVRFTSHGDSGCIHNSSTHRCPDCQVLWPLPRKIQWPEVASPQNTLEGLLKNPPTTTETLVVYQTFTRKGVPSIPAEVFQSFTFAKEGEEGEEGKRSLVQGIRYSKAVDPSQRESIQSCKSGESSSTNILADAERDHAYLRLVTLNNWYWSLFNTLSAAVMMSMEIQGNVMLSAALLSDGELITALGNLRYIFIAFFPFMLLVSVFFACYEASVEWALKTSPQKGDLISNSSWWSQWQTFVAMIAFEFFLVEKDVKDIPINLHPWKGMQDYSAFKSEGHRAYFIGYRSKTMHRVENIRSVWFCLPKQLATKVAVLVFKAFLMYRLFIFEGQNNVSVSMLASTATSLASVIWDSFNLVGAYRIRSKFYTRLIARLDKNEREDSQFRADVRLLALHFRCWWDQQRHQAIRFRYREMQKWISFDPFATPNEKCKACGRKPILHAEPKDEEPMQQIPHPKDKEPPQQGEGAANRNPSIRSERPGFNVDLRSSTSSLSEAIAADRTVSSSQNVQSVDKPQDSFKQVTFADLPDRSLKASCEDLIPPGPLRTSASPGHQVEGDSHVICTITAHGENQLDPSPVHLESLPQSISPVLGEATAPVRCIITAHGEKQLDTSPVHLEGLPQSISPVLGEVTPTSLGRHEVGELDPHTGPSLPGCPSAALAADIETADGQGTLR